MTTAERPPASESPVAEGEVLAGKYKVERVLGLGGMGVVVAARHIQLDERVALKFLRPEIAKLGGEAVARFAREGRAAAKIRSEHVARVTDVGVLESGSPYMVLEYLEGRDLAQLLEDGGPLSVDDTLEYVLQACEAIAEAHALGIVHRDLKPGNLFLSKRADRSACVKVLDFGISKMSGDSASGSAPSMTQTRVLMGSPGYMSPEQMTSTRGAGAASDIWSLGVIMYELLTGGLPFVAETMPQLVAQILANPAPLLRARRADAPATLESVVARCLAKDPAARYGSIGELALALAPLAPAHARISVDRIARMADGRGSPIGGASAPGVAAPVVTSNAAATDPTMVAQEPRSLSGRTIGILLGAALGLVVLTGGFTLWWLRAPSAAPKVASRPGAVASAPALVSAAPSADAPSASVIAGPAAPVESAVEPPVAPAAPSSLGKLPFPRGAPSARPKASAAGGVPDDRL